MVPNQMLADEYREIAGHFSALVEAVPPAAAAGKERRGDTDSVGTRSSCRRPCPADWDNDNLGNAIGSHYLVDFLAVVTPRCSILTGRARLRGTQGSSRKGNP